jgi:hypothetical protein
MMMMMMMMMTMMMNLLREDSAGLWTEVHSTKTNQRTLKGTLSYVGDALISGDVPRRWECTPKDGDCPQI